MGRVHHDRMNDFSDQSLHTRIIPLYRSGAEEPIRRRSVHDIRAALRGGSLGLRFPRHGSRLVPQGAGVTGEGGEGEGGRGRG